MDDHLLVEALRERDPGAPAAVYDAYADRLYAYCWFQLRGREAARVALRDTFIVAEAHIDKFRDPDRFATWLYSIARLECIRWLPMRGQPPDLPVANHDQEDVDQRIMAWHSALALRPLSREILDLHVRHLLPVPDLAVVLGLSVKEAEVALGCAHSELEVVLAAEVLARQGPYGCAERAELLRERRGGMSTALRERLAGHAQICAICSAFRPRSVSAAKVYRLLPRAEPPEDLRQSVMSCFLDPELVGYRLFVATRVGDFRAGGFPGQPKRPARRGRIILPRRPHRREEESSGTGVTRAVAVLGIVAFLFGGAMVTVHGLTDLGSRSTAFNGSSPRPAVSPGLPQMPVPEPRPSGDPDSDGAIEVTPISATFPLGSLDSAAPPTALPSAPPPASPQYQPAPGQAPAVPGVTGTLEVSPLFLDLAGGSDGVIELRAERGPVNWQAKPRGPVRLSPSSGRLQAGQSMKVGIHVNRGSDARGEGGVTFQPGGVQVCITWRPEAPVSSPSPTPTPTGTQPTNSPTPPETSRPATSPSSSSPEPPPAPPNSPHSGPPPSPAPPPSSEPATSPASSPTPPPSGATPTPQTST